MHWKEMAALAAPEDIAAAEVVWERGTPFLSLLSPPAVLWLFSVLLLAPPPSPAVAEWEAEGARILDFVSAFLMSSYARSVNEGREPAPALTELIAAFENFPVPALKFCISVGLMQGMAQIYREGVPDSNEEEFARHALRN